MPATPAFLDPNDTVPLLLDHQTGLFQGIKDIPVTELRAKTVELAKIAELVQTPRKRARSTTNRC